MIWRIQQSEVWDNKSNIFNITLEKVKKVPKENINTNDILTYNKYKGVDLKVLDSTVNDDDGIVTVTVSEDFNTKYLRPGILLFKKQ